MRLPLAHLPTPIEPLKRLSPPGGPMLWVKRDDMTGAESAGNKLRKLEYALGEAVAQGCDCVVTVGAPQSNHCRATAAACARLGLGCHLVLSGEPKAYEGNYFLDGLLGARIHLMAPGDTLHNASQALCERLRAANKRPYLIPLGASNAVGAQGYAQAFHEILAQEQALGLRFDSICLAVGSGGSYAGLQQANWQTGSGRRVLGFSVSQPSEHFAQAITQILREMGTPEAAAGIQINDAHAGLGYGLAQAEEIAAYLRIGALEGLALDPCYTGKAFLGMLAQLERGGFQGDQHILFIHTGGLWGWTASQRAMAADIMKESIE